MTKKAIITTHDGREASPVTKASNVLFENGQTAQDILNVRQDAMISPVIENSSSMFKVGQGDDVDYSANVVNGAYESMVLKGKTMVNCIQEPSSQDVVLPYEFTEGQSVTINDTKESGALGVELKGQTLVNLCKTPSTFLTMTQSSASINLNITHNLQANKKYAVIGEISEINAPNKGLCTWVIHADDTEAYEMKRVTNKGRFFFTYNVTKEIKTFRVYIHGDDRNNGGTITIGNLMITEYQEGMENWDIPYFEGMKSVQAPSVTTTNTDATQSTTLTTPEKITLRGIGNVKDTLNTVTGELTQRIGEVVLDGLTGWLNTNYSTSSTVCFDISINLKGKIYEQSSSAGLICAELPPKNWIHFYGSKTDEEGVVLNRDSGTIMHIKISRDKLTTHDYNGVTNYLKQNPITVQYELATPITSTVSLTFTNQDNQPTTKLSTYNTTTHINTSSKEGSLIPTLLHVNPSYPVILKPSTKYSIVADSYSNGHTNSAINFNLGGATASTTVGNRVSTVTTPSTLTSDKLVMSGRGNKLNNVMVIEGDVVGDEPYFEGICDCKSPILSNVEKNLFDGELESGTIGYAGNLSEDTTRARSKNYIPIDSSQSYHLINYENYIFRAYYEYDSNKKFIRQIPSVGQSLILSFTSNTKYIKFVIAKPDSTSAIDSFTQKIAIYLGNDTIITYEPYKSNILSCNGDRIELTEDVFEQGTINANVNQPFEQCKGSTTQRLRNKELLQLKQGVYSISIPSDYSLIVASFRNGLYESTSGWQGSKYTLHVVDTSTSFGFIIKKNDNTTITTANFNESHFEIREVDKTIVLRSLPSGVCDTLNVETGEYVQRISEVMLDGSEQGWILGTDANWYADGDTFGFYFNDFKLAQGTSLYIDKFLSTPNIHSNDMEGCYINTEWSWVGVRIYKTKLPSLTVDAFKQWLSQNPITVQYELATPIVKTVDLSGYPFAYENGHVILSSGSIEQSLTPIIEYSAPTNRNGQIRTNQKMVEKHQKELDKLQAIILANLVNSQYNQTLTTLKYELSRV